MFACECGRKFTTKSGLGKHKKFCGNYGIFLDGGYECRINSNGKQIRIHREIMEQKLGRKLTSNEIVHHIDENKRNNDPDNLELLKWGKHSSIHMKGSINSSSKLTESQVVEIRLKLQDQSASSVARQYNMSPSAIDNIKHFRTWL